MGTMTEKPQQFTGKIGLGPGFAEFLVRLTVTLREKDLHSATRNVIPENAENNYRRPIPLNSSAPITKEAYQKDRSLTAILMNSLTGDAFIFATQKFPITETTQDDEFIGLRLYIGIKEKYDIALTRSEIFRRKQEIINYQLRGGNISIFIKELTNKRHFILSHAKFSDGQISLLDEDILQSILTKLPENFSVFTQKLRNFEQYAVPFSTFTLMIEEEDREMQAHRHHPPHHPPPIKKLQQ